jgi:hypothetical protein
MNQAEIDALMDGIAPVIAESRGMTRAAIAAIAKQIRDEVQTGINLVCTRIDEREAQIRKDFENRVAAIESRGIEFRGTWQRACDYARGAMVVNNGSLWACTAEQTRTEPGTSPDWQLAAKAGRDAR